MPQIICPNCGARTDTRAPDYPFCARCQDNLAKCGYCRWFSASTTSCIHPIVAGVFEVSDEAMPPCVYHSPSDRLLERRPLLGLLVWVLVVVVIGVLGYGLARLLSRPDTYAATHLELSVEADYEGAVVGEPHAVTAQIYNSSGAIVPGIRFEIAEQSLEQFALRSSVPGPDAVERHGIWTVLSYPALGPRERRRISLELVPKKAGAHHLLVRLVSEDNLFHGMADLPIIVEAAPGEVTPPRRVEEQESPDATN